MGPRDTAYLLVYPGGPTRAVQVEAVRRAGLDPDDDMQPVYSDGRRGRKPEPAALTDRKEMLRAMQERDRVLVYTLACLAVSVIDAEEVVRALVPLQARVRELQTGREYDLATPAGVLEIGAAFRRQRTGRGSQAARDALAAKVAAGEVVPGPAPKAKPEEIERAARLWIDPDGPSMREIGRIVGLSHVTLERHLRALAGCERAIAQDRVKMQSWDAKAQALEIRRKAEAALARRKTKTFT